MTEPVPSPDLDLVTAALRADSADATIYAQVLTESLGESLPPGCVTIERDRSVSDRMHGRPGKVSKITVRLGEQVMTLAVRAGQPNAEILREVRGVVLSRQPVARARMGGRTGPRARRLRRAECPDGRGAAQAGHRHIGGDYRAHAVSVTSAAAPFLPAFCPVLLGQHEGSS